MAALICVGSAALHQIYDVPALPTGAETVTAHSYRQTGAGLAADAAVAVCQLGGKAELWSQLGDDETGDRIVANLDRYGVDIASLRRVAGGQSPVSSVIAATDGHHQITRFNGVGAPANADWLPLSNIQDANAVLADPNWPAGALAALGKARDHRRPGILAIDDTQEPVPATLANIASHILVMPAGLTHFSDLSDPDAALSAAAHATGAIVGVTSGFDGVRWCEPGGIPQSMPPMKIECIDPAATWDTFCGAFALAIGEEKPLDTTVAFAGTAAALTGAVQGRRRAMPDRSAVWQRMAIDFPAIAEADG